MNIAIICLDINNVQQPALYSFNDVLDINDISSISIGPFYSQAQQEELYQKFPKSYKACKPKGFDFLPSGKIDFTTHTYYVSFSFDTFHSTLVTGIKNEAAEARRLKVINKIKSLI